MAYKVLAIISVVLFSLCEQKKNNKKKKSTAVKAICRAPRFSCKERAQGHEANFVALCMHTVSAGAGRWCGQAEEQASRIAMLGD
jgi:hypothetical protein